MKIQSYIKIRAITCIYFVRRLFARLHTHHWEGSVWNKWGVAVEEECKCGASRWHSFEHLRGFGEPPDWQEGRHPNRPSPNEKGQRPDCNRDAMASFAALHGSATVELQFMVVPELLATLAYVPDPVRCKIIDAEAIFLIGILGESGRKLVKAGIEFYFTRPLAEKLISKGIAVESPNSGGQPVRIETTDTEHR